MNIRWFVLFMGFNVWAGTLAAQYDNSHFFQRMEMDSLDAGNLYLGFHTLQFNKDNEYFNRIADGYTLFGFQLNPYLSYYPSKNARIDIGAFVRKDFGNNKFSEIAPTFSVKLKHKKFSLQFGNIDGSVHHELPEPMYDFETVMVNRPELGFQIMYEGDKFWADNWINWEQMIYPGDPIQEFLSGGTSMKFRLGKTLTVPLQILMFHQGGQIDSSPVPLVTRTNIASGIQYKKDFHGFVEQIRMDNYFLIYKDFSPKRRSAFEDGYGWYLNVAIKTKIHSTIMLSYWLGEEYIPIKGAALYSSSSFTYKHPDHLEPQRELLFLRLMSNYKVFEGMTLSSRLEPYYDFRNGKLNFSMGMYINYNPEFLLKSGVKTRK